MDLLDRLLEHDLWTTQQFLGLCRSLSDEALDRPCDLGHRTLRRTFDHLIWNMEVWSSLMAGTEIVRSDDQTLDGLSNRLQIAGDRFQRVARMVRDRNGWNETWVDVLDQPPREKTFGTAIAHLLTHSMHHRAQILYLLRQAGLTGLPEGDLFSWEADRDQC